MTNSIKEAESLMETVVKGGYCVGCGACSAVENSPIRMELDADSKYQATLDIKDVSSDFKKSVLEVCPFSDQSLNEDQIGKDLYGSHATMHDKLGYIISTYAGYVAQDNFREMGSSGGMGTWILSELLSQGLVDGVIHVKERKDSEDHSMIFKYSISTTLDEVIEGAKSRYYPIEISEVINLVRNRPGKYAIVGLPCFIKSIRLLTKQDPVLNERIKYCIGLICGHLKSENFAKMWAWQCGVHPDNLESIDFRTKLEGYTANQYGVTIKGEIDNKKVAIQSPPLNQLFGANWGWGLFKYKACDYCDDVTAETADITIGDAWLPKYLNDSKGTNIIIVRNPIINELIIKCRLEKKLIVEEISPQEAIASQSSGFSHRREALSFRLFLADEEKKWRPQKRVLASNSTISDLMKTRQILRMDMARTSHSAFNESLRHNDFNIFKNQLDPIIKEYKRTYAQTIGRKVLNKIKKYLKKY
ncbi:Coenzyme F420 hydrogenase/dehydrogenase, beta subunit C-terminal domain [Albibacterium bauzanense]|uniref:Coenzyme F420-reducing hydrogenase beta subunit n=1 Tax=Albibacterium bauzanense TaxID=653929 RepID=A0A4V2PY79_9SPHI|nr:Coenzyme F420 hydrogenase/dehydrogenase, beta subunit C-terminal domain [Albibacterium bauzanense]TCK84941.1 coenzyme F420-reducing hydrogenase beta subunit [Albibacterium bauzanense]